MGFSSAVTMTTANAFSGSGAELTTGNYFFAYEETTSISFTIIKPTSGFIKSDTSLKTGVDDVIERPRVLLLDNGNMAVIYATTTSGTSTLAYQIVDSVGTIVQTEQILRTGGTYDELNAVLAFDTGNIIITYSTTTAMLGVVYNQAFQEQVVETSLFSGSNFNSSHSSITPKSQLVIAIGDTTSDKIYWGVFTSALVEVETPFDISPADIVSEVRIAALSNESSAIVWKSSASGNQTKHSIITIAGSKTVDDILVASGDNVRPDVIGGKNHFYVSYIDGDDDLIVKRFTNTGTVLSTTEVVANGGFSAGDVQDFADFKLGDKTPTGDVAFIWKQ